MKYATVCSGIEAPSVAWDSLGWEPQWFSEIEPFPASVLNHHYPNVPNLGDMTRIHETETFKQSTLDLLCGGTPCQSFSVAGLRKGLDDPRGNLMLTFLSLADRKRPRWVVWENVPGVLSSNGGRDFGTFLGALGQLGYGFAYRVLDAQYFGVAQRRRRVFVVGCLGDWRGAAAVLFERHSLSGYPAPRRQTGQEVTQIAGTLTSNGGGATRPAGNANELDFCVVQSVGFSAGNSDKARGIGYTEEGTPPLRAGMSGTNQVPTIAYSMITANTNANGLGVSREVSPTLDCAQPPAIAYGIDEECNVSDQHFGPLLRGGQGGTRQAVAFQQNASGELRAGEVSYTLNTNSNASGRNTPMVLESVAFAQNTRDEVRLVGGDGQIAGALAAQPGMKQTTYVAQSFADISDCLTASYGTKWNGNASADNGSLFAHQGMALRRLTPMECERLQGFPDGWTDIKPKGKPTPDGVRYKALGNSMAVPVLYWIGSRIQMVDKLL